MYLENVLERDPGLLRAALELHRSGRVPTNSWVIDLDAIAANADVLAGKAGELGLRTYVMSKQHGRNPYVNAVAQARGLGPVVAVDATCALLCMRYGIPLGHVGHLNQIPRGLMPKILQSRPEVWTVYSAEHARFVGEAAAELGLVQDLLVRVRREGDFFFNGIEGGVLLEDLASVAEAARATGGARVVGATAFPCLRYDEAAGQAQETTRNVETVRLAARELERLGLEVLQLNMPGNTSSGNMALLKAAGATHVEPGNALLGTTPSNAFSAAVPERTAFAYVTEVLFFHGGKAFAHGGGCYHTNYSKDIFGLVGRDWEGARRTKVRYDWDQKQDIDYHMKLAPEAGQDVRVGDTAVFAYRTQMHMTRSFVAPVSGLSGKRPLRVHGIFDNAGTALDGDFRPTPIEAVKADLAALAASYA